MCALLVLDFGDLDQGGRVAVELDELAEELFLHDVSTKFTRNVHVLVTPHPHSDMSDVVLAGAHGIRASVRGTCRGWRPRSASR